MIDDKHRVMIDDKHRAMIYDKHRAMIYDKHRAMIYDKNRASASILSYSGSPKIMVGHSCIFSIIQFN